MGEAAAAAADDGLGLAGDEPDFCQTLSESGTRFDRVAASWRQLLPQARSAALELWRDPAGPLICLVVVLAVGLRIYLLVRWQPAFVNYSDTGIYISDAYSGGFTDPLRPSGYGLFLISLHWISPHLLLVTVVQHGLGLLSAGILYWCVRRCGAPRWVALVPLAAVALGGTQIFLEHAILSEAVFTFLVIASLYCATRATGQRLEWAIASGALIGLAVPFRAVGMFLIPVIAAWLLLPGLRVSRVSALKAGAALAASLVVLGSYLTWQHAKVERWSVVANGQWNLYGRVAPFADCTEFTPPSGTEGLCDPTPPDRRYGRNVEYYIYIADAPAQRLFGPPFRISPDPEANDKLRRFTLAVLQAQPGDYLSAVWDDLVRIVDPDHRSQGDLSQQGLIDFLLHDVDGDDTNDLVDYWRSLYYPADTEEQKEIDVAEDWERLTRPRGPMMLAVLLLAASAAWVAPPAARRLAALSAMTGFSLLVVPILTHAYDARFVIPSLGPLFAAAALGAWGLWGRWSAVRLDPVPAPPAEPIRGGSGNGLEP